MKVELLVASAGPVVLFFMATNLYRFTRIGWPRKQGKPNLTWQTNPAAFAFLTAISLLGTLGMAWGIAVAVLQL